MYTRRVELLSSIRRGLTAKRESTLSNLVGFRFMSVTNISDFEGTEKFTEMNAKSVMYFTAKWCPPCKVIKPVYEKLSDKYGDVAFGKIDIDENQIAATEYQISSVPTFVFFNGKDKYGQFSGADKAQLESLIDDLDRL